MCSLQLKEAKFKLHQYQYLYIPQFCLFAGQFWAVVGSNGSGKTAFALALQQQLALEHGDYCHSFQQVALLSFEKQQHLIEATFKDRNHDGISPDDFGKSARETILNGTTATTKPKIRPIKIRFTKLPWKNKLNKRDVFIIKSRNLVRMHLL